MKEKKTCYSCGSEKELTKVENATAKTKGFPLHIKKGYACKPCLDNKRIV